MSLKKGKTASGRGRRKGGLPPSPASSIFKPLASAPALLRNPFLKAVHALSKKNGVRAYLVGGALRNLHLSRPLGLDLDFVLEDGIGGFPQAAAKRLGGSAFVLDKETGAARVVVKKGRRAYTLDFSPLAGADIVADLKKRDFTVNATAVPLAAVFEDAQIQVIDPSGGVGDAKRGVLRATGKRVFKQDPLRCLRALRLSQQYGLSISADTGALLKAGARLLENTSLERVRDELMLIFSNPGVATSVGALFKTGIARAVLPEVSGWTGLKGYGLLTHSLKTLKEAEDILSGFSVEFPRHARRLERHFSSSIGTVKRAAFFRLCAFLHDIGKPATMEWEAGRLRFIGHDSVGAGIAALMCRRLRMSRKVTAEFSAAVKNHHRVFGYVQLMERGAMAKGHFFRSAGGKLGVDLIFLAVADARATRGREDPEVKMAATGLLDFYFGVFTRKRPRPVLTGDEVMRIFGVGQGPLVGEILEKISERIESGDVRNRRDAIGFVRAWLESRGAEQGDTERFED